MSDTLDFISILRLKREDFLTTMTPAEEAVMAKHREYVQNLINDGKVILAGAGLEGTLGLVLIYRVDSAIEARRHFYNDPAVIAGIGYPELHPFQIGYLG
jgi:hypothetical protein